jgi:hypothetical protein
MAAHATPKPPTSGKPRRAGVAVIIMITPDFLFIICGATALAVRNCVRVVIVMGREKSSSDIWVSGTDGIEADFNAVGLGNSGSVFFEGLSIESVYLGGFGCATRARNFLRDYVEFRKRAAGQKDLRPFTGKGTHNRTPDRAASSVNYRFLVLQ